MWLVSTAGAKTDKVSYRGTQCVTLSAAVCLDLNNSKRFKSSRGHKFRRSGVSQSELFVTGGDPPMRATSPHADGGLCVSLGERVGLCTRHGPCGLECV